jgi:hypothetical protein
MNFVAILAKPLFTSSTRLLACRSHISPTRVRPFSSSKHNKFAMVAFQSDWSPVPTHGSSIPAYSVFNKPIEKPLQDDREYRTIKLENGLSATVVHDPTADKAAASLDVSVGHLSDPVSHV